MTLTTNGIYVIVLTFCLCITLGIRKNEHGNPEDEENFEEAVRAVNFAVLPTQIPKNIQDIINDDCCINLHSKVIQFPYCNLKYCVIFVYCIYFLYIRGISRK